MAKRARSEHSVILLGGFGHSIKGDDVYNVFSKFGKIETIKFIGRRQCLIQFDCSESGLRAMQLHNTRQSALNASFLSVTLANSVENTIKRPNISPGPFVMLDPPRFNNFLIPVLPSFMSN